MLFGCFERTVCSVFPVRVSETDQAHNDLQNRGTRRGKAYVEQGRGHLPAHEKSDGNADAKRADDSLNHHEFGHSQPVEKADIAEQETGQQAVDGVGFQVVGGSGNDLRIVGEDAREQIAVPESNGEHHYGQYGGYADGIAQRGLGAIIFSRAHVLRDKGGHAGIP